MTSPDLTELAVRFRNEGEVLRKQAAADLEAAQTERAHIERRHRDIEQLEANISRRERKLAELQEPTFLEREKAADAKLAEAKALKADWNAVKHGAAQALISINARDAAREAAARETPAAA